MARFQTVTRDGWNVSTTSSSREPGVRVLSVFKIHGRIFQYGEANGKRFDSHEAATAYALERGYLQQYVTPWCPHCRQLHEFLGRKSSWCESTSSSTHSPGVYNPRTRR